MPDPIQPQDLLDQAWPVIMIAEPAVDQPRAAEYRRAVSSVYYELFHVLTLASASLFAPSA